MTDQALPLPPDEQLRAEPRLVAEAALVLLPATSVRSRADTPATAHAIQPRRPAHNRTAPPADASRATGHAPADFKRPAEPIDEPRHPDRTPLVETPRRPRRAPAVETLSVVLAGMGNGASADVTHARQPAYHWWPACGFARVFDAVTCRMLRACVPLTAPTCGLRQGREFAAAVLDAVGGRDSLTTVRSR